MSREVLIQEVERGRLHRVEVLASVVAGREKGACGLVVRGRDVSRRHCELRAELDGRLRVKDTSKLGTFVNGQRLEGEGLAGPGDVIGLGRSVQLRHLGVLDGAGPRRDRGGVLLLPQRISAACILLRQVGRGGMGVVYEGWHEGRRQRCAVKVLRPPVRTTARILERFRREAILQGSLRDYPGIVSAYELDVLPDGDELYIVMEFVPGNSLMELAVVGLEPAEAARLVARTARAVQYAHEHGVIHRDLKPNNVVVTPQGQVRLTDFGIAKALEGQDGITATGELLGTPAYMAPEQIDDSSDVGPPADVYGLGGILYTALTGQLPFTGERVSEILRRVRDGLLRPPRELAPAVPPQLDALCLRAMAMDPARRPPSAEALAEELEAWLRTTQPRPAVRLETPPAAPPWAGRPRQRGSGSSSGEG